MVTFKEKAAQPFNPIVIVISHFGFDGKIAFIVVPAPGHCLHFTFDAHYLLYFLIRAIYLA